MRTWTFQEIDELLGEAAEHEEVVLCDSCHYSTTKYNGRAVCDRCLRAKTFWRAREREITPSAATESGTAR